MQELADEQLAAVKGLLAEQIPTRIRTALSCQYTDMLIKYA